MEEEKVESKVYSKVPAKVTMWNSFKNFWLHPIVLELTPHQKKVFQEVHDFWNQEIYIEKGEVRLRKPQTADSIINEEEAEIKISL